MCILCMQPQCSEISRRHGCDTDLGLARQVTHQDLLKIHNCSSELVAVTSHKKTTLQYYKFIFFHATDTYQFTPSDSTHAKRYSLTRSINCKHPATHWTYCELYMKEEHSITIMQKLPMGEKDKDNHVRTNKMSPTIYRFFIAKEISPQYPRLFHLLDSATNASTLEPQC